MNKNRDAKLKKKILRHLRQQEKKGAVIWIIEVARLLKISDRQALELIKKLYRKKKLEIYAGSKIRTFRPGFRFPEEIREMLKLIIHDKIHNVADAAENFVEELEKIIRDQNLKKFNNLKCWGKHWPYLSKTVRKMAINHLLETKRPY